MKTIVKKTDSQLKTEEIIDSNMTRLYELKNLIDAEEPKCLLSYEKAKKKVYIELPKTKDEIRVLAIALGKPLAREVDTLLRKEKLECADQSDRDILDMFQGIVKKTEKAEEQ